MSISSPLYERIRQDRRFHHLVSRRNRLTGTLLAVILVLFFGYMALVSFHPGLIALRLGETSNLTFGVAAAVFLYVAFIGLAGYYVHRANDEFDGITRELTTEVEQEDAV